MNTRTNYYYLLYAENSDAGDPTSLAHVTHYPTLKAAKRAMNFFFEQHKKLIPLPAVMDDDHYVVINDEDITVRDDYDSYRWEIGRVVLVDGGFGE